MSYYYEDRKVDQDCRWRCLCYESRCCGGLHTAAGCRAWSRVSVCSAQSTARPRHWLNVNDDQSACAAR